MARGRRLSGRETAPTAFIKAAELRKARDTYLVGIRRELVQHDDDGCWYVHPSYNLNTVITFRSSADQPSYQNLAAAAAYAAAWPEATTSVDCVTGRLMGDGSGAQHLTGDDKPSAHPTNCCPSSQ